MEELHAWLTLAHTHGISPNTADKLLNYFICPTAILSTEHQQLVRSGLTPELSTKLLQSCSSKPLEQLIRRTRIWLESPLNHVIHRNDERYPPLLKELVGSPVVLYVTGDPEALLTPAVAIVGSRKSAQPALNTTNQLVRQLAARGITIISGLAKGIDYTAHRATLDVNGLTIAVTGTGLDRVYPASHHALSQSIAAAGALVSEFPLGAGPMAYHFPRRNRIISGLSLGVVVIEAALKSGSLITARHASEQGREVMVLPGSVSNPLVRGSHELIRNGAVLVQSADEILSEIAPQIDIDPRITSGSPPNSAVQGSLETAESCALLAHFGFEPATIDTLIERSGLSARDVATWLLQLEIEGKVASLSGGRYARC